MPDCALASDGTSSMFVFIGIGARLKAQTLDGS
jgi:hypothetical protein